MYRRTLLLLFFCAGCSNAGRNSYYVPRSLDESDSIGAAFYQRAMETARSSPKDMKIWLGYDLGMNDSAFNAMTAQLVKDSKMKSTGKKPFEGMYSVDFGGKSLDVDINLSNTGIFSKNATLSFRTKEECSDTVKTQEDADAMITWAKTQFNTDPVVTFTMSFNDQMQQIYSKRYSWIHGSYTVDVVTISCCAALTFRATRLD